MTDVKHDAEPLARRACDTTRLRGLFVIADRAHLNVHGALGSAGTRDGPNNELSCANYFTCPNSLPNLVFRPWRPGTGRFPLTTRLDKFVLCRYSFFPRLRPVSYSFSLSFSFLLALYHSRQPSTLPSIPFLLCHI